jgi:hypothetical protein
VNLVLLATVALFLLLGKFSGDVADEVGFCYNTIIYLLQGLGEVSGEARFMCFMGEPFLLQLSGFFSEQNVFFCYICILWKLK